MIMHDSNFVIEVVYYTCWCDYVKDTIHPSELNYQPRTSSTEPHAFCFENLVIALTRLLKDKYHAEAIYSIRLLDCYGPETLKEFMDSHYTFEALLYARTYYEKRTTWAVFNMAQRGRIEFQGTKRECRDYAHMDPEWDNLEVDTLKPFYAHSRRAYFGEY